MIHFFELLLFNFKILVLSLHDLLMLIQEFPHVIQFIISEDLELFEVGCDFSWWWNRSHFCDACLQELMLWLDYTFIVTHELLELEHWCHTFLFFKNGFGSGGLAEDFELRGTLIYIFHESTKLLKVLLELMNDLSPSLIEWQCKEPLFYLLKFMLQDFLRVDHLWFTSIEVLGLEPLHVDVTLQFDDVEHFSL